MNHIRAYAVARAINHDRIETAQRRRREHRMQRPQGPTQRPSLRDVVRLQLLGPRPKAEPSR